MLKEELTDKTIRSSDKVKVARVIADMLGVEKAESMSPDVAITTGLRKIKNKRMTPELTSVLKKMLNLAQEVGIKIDSSLLPKTVTEGNDLIKFKKFAKIEKINDGIVPIEGGPYSKKAGAGMQEPPAIAAGSSPAPAMPEKTPTAPSKSTRFASPDNPNTAVDGEIPSETGHTLDGKRDNDTMRRMRVKKLQQMDESFIVKDADGKVVHTSPSERAAKQYAQELSKNTGKEHTVHFDRAATVKEGVIQPSGTDKVAEDLSSADFKVNPVTNRKYRAHRVEFANSNKRSNPIDKESNDRAIRNRSEKDNEDIKTQPLLKKVTEEVEDDEHHISEDDIDKIVDSVDEPEDILDVYDGDELEIIDTETGDVIEDEDKHINEELLNEVLSRMARMKARIKFLQSKSKRARKLQIALKSHSSNKVLNSRARKLAIQLLKQRIMKKPVAQMTVAEKERAESIIKRKKAVIDRIAMKLVPRIRKIENARLSHSKFTKKG